MLDHVNNAVYLSDFETARTHYNKAWGPTTADPERDTRIIIRSAEIREFKEMPREENYVVTARTTAFRATSVSVSQDLWSGDLHAR